MTEKGCNEQNLRPLPSMKVCNEQNLHPFFSMLVTKKGENLSKKYEIFLPLDDNGNYLPIGCTSSKNGDEIWSKREACSIQKWAKEFVKDFGYQGDIENQDINITINPENKTIEFLGDFGSLKINDKANVDYESPSNINPEPTSL